jgi:hypothetical protein
MFCMPGLSALVQPAKMREKNIIDEMEMRAVMITLIILGVIGIILACKVDSDEICFFLDYGVVGGCWSARSLSKWFVGGCGPERARIVKEIFIALFVVAGAECEISGHM